MARRMLIDATHPEETRVVVLNGSRLEEFDFETSTKKQIKGNIYLAKITRVEPSLQAAFVEYGGNRHGFLAFSEIHPDYYRIPVSDREAMLAEERAAEEEAEHHGERPAEPDDAAAEGEASYESIGDAEFEAPEGLNGEYRDRVDHDHHDHGHDEPQLEAAPPAEEHTAPGHAPEPGRAPEPASEPAPGPAAQPTAEGLTIATDYAPPEKTDDAAHEESAASFETGEPVTAGHGGAETAAHSAGDTAVEPGTRIVEMHDEPVPVETVGGDEFEEVQARPRVRHYRNYKIQEVIKRRQIILVQVTKEERGNKGAALTTYLSLAGRYCVLMPNAGRGGGVSRKITSAADRRRLKELMDELEVPDGMGIIVRTAGSERSKAEIKRDYEYLLRLWDDIRELTLRSSAPALIYEEGNLIKRAIRDLYTRDMEEILVEGEEGYRTAKEFMRMLMPSHSARVKPYRDPTIPLLHRFQVDSQIDQVHNPVVQLRSGGYIVINPTEALVSIDVNSGRATRERNIEETATKTNLEAAEEIARQLRLRDLAGLVVIDFIDMEETRNQKAVEARLKDAMKTDRARIQLGRISAFGLLELSRQRMRSSLIEASTQPCPHCNGTGTIRSTESTALVVLRALEEEGIRRRTAEVAIYVPTQIALYVLNQKRDALMQIEQRYHFSVAVAADDALIPPAHRLDRLRAFTPIELAALPAAQAVIAEEEEEEEFFEDEAELAAEARADGEEVEGAEGEQGRRKRRRRKRRRGGEGDERPMQMGEAPEAEAGAGDSDEEGADAEEAGDDEDEGVGQPSDGERIAADGGERKRRRRGKRGGRRRRREDQPQPEPVPGEGPQPDYVDPFEMGYPSALDYARDGREHIFAERVEVAPESPGEPAREMTEAVEAAASTAPALPEVTGEAPEAVIEASAAEMPAETTAPAPKRRRAPRKKAAVAEAAPAEAAAEVTEPVAQPVADTVGPVPEAAPPKKRRVRKPAAKKAAAAADPVEAVPVAEPPAAEPLAAEPVAAEPVAAEPVAAEPVAVAPPEPEQTPEPEPVPEPAMAETAEPPAAPEPPKPRRTGWWKRLIE